VAVTLSATISDAASGNSNVVKAEYFVSTTGANDAGCDLGGVFGTPTVNVNTTVPTSGATAPCVDLATLPHGNHTFYVHGQDALGNWGSFNFIVLNLDKAGPMTSGIALNPAVSNGLVAVAIQAIGSDSMTGGSNVTGADYTVVDSVDASTFGGMLMPNQVAATVSLNGTISAANMLTLAEGAHTLSIMSYDELGNMGMEATATLVVDKTGPVASAVNVYPDPNNGTLGVNPVTPSVRVDVSLTDAVANVVAAEGFIDRADQAGNQDPGLGNGFPFTPLDGLFNSGTEGAYAFIPLSTINALPIGTHTIWVRGKDAAGNWGATASDTLTIDKTKPTVTAPVASPNPTNGAASITLTSSASDAGTGGSNIARAEWFRGTDPGAGNGTAMAASDGSFNSPNESLTATIDVRGWPEGNSTVYVRARDAAGNWSLTANTIVVVTRQVYFSTFGNTNPPGVGGAADDADIYYWNLTAFSRMIDASVLGLPNGANVDGLVRVDNTHFYLSFSANSTTVPGIGNVQDEDVVYYNAGTWSVYFDGTAAGLTAANQDLDAFDIVGGVLYFSTAGNTNPPGVAGAADDADIYAWNGTSFSRVFDASVAGLPAGANVDGYVRDDATHFFLSFSGATTAIPGIGNVQDEDVVYYNAGTWSVYFDGTAKGLTADNQDLDAFDLP